MGLIDLPPEIQTQILSHLSSHDLTQCILVSQAWSFLFSPPLWRSISIYKQQKERRKIMRMLGAPSPEQGQGHGKVQGGGGHGGAIDFSHFKKWILEDDGRGPKALLRNGHLIRELRTEMCSVLDLVVEADEKGSVRELEEVMYFSDPLYGGSDLIADNIWPEFLTSFEVCPWLFRQDDDEEEEECPGPPRTRLEKSALVQLLRQNGNLRRLTIFGTVNLHQYESSHQERHSNDGSIVSSWLEALPGSLETLSMDTPRSIYDNVRIGKEGCPAFSLPVLDRLHTLSLMNIGPVYSGNRFDVPSNFYADLLRACPNLKALRFPIQYTPSRHEAGFTGHREQPLDFAKIIQESCPNLTALCIDGQIPDAQFAELLGSSRRGWRSIKIGDRLYSGYPKSITTNDFGPLAIKALLQHAGTLESVRFHNCHRIPSESLQELLCTAPKLRQFHSIATSSFVKEATLDARDIVQSEWVCSNLESLACKITHIPRPDLTLQGTIEEFIADQNMFELDYGPTLATSFSSFSLGYSIDESRRLQAQVYNQLARLPHLQDLILNTKRFTFGRRCYGFGPSVIQGNGEVFKDCRQPDGLPMTLASGMDVLKNLQKLRRVASGGIPVGFDNEAEKAWREEHWPGVVVADLSAFQQLEDSCWSALFDIPLDWCSAWT